MDAARAVERLTLSIEDFNSVFIRLSASDRLSFSALSVLHTLSRVGPCRLSELVRTEQIKQPALDVGGCEAGTRRACRTQARSA